MATRMVDKVFLSIIRFGEYIKYFKNGRLNAGVRQ